MFVMVQYNNLGYGTVYEETKVKEELNYGEAITNKIKDSQ